MNSCNFEEVSKKINEEYQENCKKIITLNGKIRVLKSNQFGMRVCATLACSLPFWIAMLFLVPNLIKASLLPIWGAGCISVAVPLLFGTVLEQVLFKKAGWRKDLRNFSNAKTEKEKREEEIRYEIEKGKLKSANQILRKNYGDLKATENLTNSLSTMYHATLEDEKDRTKEEILENVENLENLFQKKQQEVAVMATKEVLKEQFYPIREKFMKASEVSLYLAEGLLFPMLAYHTPSLIGQLNLASNMSLFEALAPAIVGGIVSVGYGLKKLRDDMQVFQKINQELGENKLSDKVDDDKESEFHQEHENLITDVACIRLELESEKQRLKQEETSSIRKPLKEEETMQFTDSLSNDTSLEKAPTLKKVKSYK